MDKYDLFEDFVVCSYNLFRQPTSIRWLKKEQKEMFLWFSRYIFVFYSFKEISGGDSVSHYMLLF